MRSSPLLPGIFALLLCGAAAAADARTDEPPPPSEAEQEADPRTPPSESSAPGDAGDVAPPPDEGIHPAAVSPFRTRAYRIKPKKLWSGLLQTLEGAGFIPEQVDARGRTVKTEFREFKGTDYAEQVGERPPLLGGGYFILQKNTVSAGSAAIEAIVAPKGRGAELRMRARILVQGLDRRRGSVRVMTDRRSSGVIEDDLFSRLESSLGLERLPDNDGD